MRADEKDEDDHEKHKGGNISERKGCKFFGGERMLFSFQLWGRETSAGNKSSHCNYSLHQQAYLTINVY